MSSDGVEWLSGAGRGHAYDPQTGQFALASTAYSAVTATGVCGMVTAVGYDLAPGTGWYLTGTLSLPPVQPQTAVASSGEADQGRGQDRAAEEVRGHQCWSDSGAVVTWSTKKSAKGTKAKYATWKTKRSGKVVIITTGAAKRLYVKLALTAPAVHGYTAYQYTKTWRVPAG